MATPANFTEADALMREADLQRLCGNEPQAQSLEVMAALLAKPDSEAILRDAERAHRDLLSGAFEPSPRSDFED